MASSWTRIKTFPGGTPGSLADADGFIYPDATTVAIETDGTITFTLDSVACLMPLGQVLFIDAEPLV